MPSKKQILKANRFLDPKDYAKIKKSDVQVSDTKQMDLSKYKFLSDENRETIHQLSPSLKGDVAKVLDKSDKIEKALSDEKNKKLFMENPVQFFEKNKIPLSKAAKNKLMKNANELKMEPKSYQLPNGKKVKVNLNYNFKNK